MLRLPVIVSFGGFNAAGRSSFHQGYYRTVLENISTSKRQQTLSGLGLMTGLLHYDNGHYIDDAGNRLNLADIEKIYGQQICDETLIRKIRPEYFDIDRVPSRQPLTLSDEHENTLTFSIRKRRLPAELPPHWQLEGEDDKGNVLISLSKEASLTVNSHYRSPVQSAGQLPSGFNPGAQYESRFHPRGLQLAINGASDAINALGIDWQTVMDAVGFDEVGAYSASAMSQLDHYGNGGLLQARLKGDRVTSKQLALGFNSMPSDFINAYVLGNLGTTGSIAGACASFLYNLRAGVADIQSGRRRVVVVSSSEAPILPEVIDGYNTMGALATSEKLSKVLQTGEVDLRKSSRPFGENCGFVIAESTQHVVLMDDALALELGANIYGAVPAVFVHADGYKKSISAPGPGNYITLAKSVADACSLLGDKRVANGSFVQAHGSSTPQNRVSEANILNRTAEAFGIENWPVTAVKAFVGHSIAAASGDQLVNSLGIFAEGILPGIKTIDRVADDVCQDRLMINTQDRQLEQPAEVAFLNSKGFGGNNATASVLSPEVVKDMLQKRHGSKTMHAYQEKLEKTCEQADNYNQAYLKGDTQVSYQFGENMVAEDEIHLSRESISVTGYKKPIDLIQENLYKDML